VSKKILIVDDEPNLVKLCEIRLKASGYEVVTAHDGQEALDKVKQEMPDLIILDHMMPKLDGFEVCRLLKSDEVYEAYKDIPIVMLTASGQAQEIVTGLQKGVAAYITKPFKSDVLLGIIKGLV
jgi:two-component system, OmpR family, alkaline phosphatase synthesis response regulator PhoP